MLRFANKEDLWQAKNVEARRRIEPEPFNWQFQQLLDRLAAGASREDLATRIHACWAAATNTLHFNLKTYQDGLAIEMLGELGDKEIAEVGGGICRILQNYTKNNTCYNIDRFDGLAEKGRGPDYIPDIPGIKPIIGRVGEPLAWPQQSFDVIFSISVVEHVPTDKLDAFFSDCHRLLKPRGRMLHLIDIYLSDHHSDRTERAVSERIESYGNTFSGGKFIATGPVVGKNQTKFSCSYLTNPDHTMAQWNRIAPELSQYRHLAQSCILIMEGIKSDKTP